MLESKVVNHVTCVKLAVDRLDAARTAEFKDKIEGVINQNANHVILNLSAIKFMDSTGLGAAVSVLKMLGSHRELILCGVSGMLVDLFKLTKMDRVFNIVDSEASALSAINAK